MAVKPMLAVKAADLDSLPYPLLASVKLDGIRCLITPEGPQTRSGEPIPNLHMRSLLATLPVGLDGEIVCLNDKGMPDFRLTTGNVRRHTGEPPFVYYVFDHFGLPLNSFSYRLDALMIWGGADPIFPGVPTARVEPLCHIPVNNAAEVRDLFEQFLSQGQEGLILRHPKGLYKHGRSTLKEAGMLKVKPYEDAEAYVIEAFERFHNGNEATKDNLGHTKRSSAKGGRKATGLLGGFKVVRLEDVGVDGARIFEVSAGKTTHEEKASLWAARDYLPGKIIRYQFVTVGGYDVPRHATFQGFRDPWDLDPGAVDGQV